MSEVLERVIYEPEIFPAAIYYMDRPKLTMLIFQNGKTIIAGAKSEEEIAEAYQKTLTTLEPIGLGKSKVITSMSLEESLRKVLQSGKDWQRVPVKGAPGIFVLKAPAARGRPASLLVEINPVGPDGAPTKRRGLRNLEELNEYRKLISEDRLEEILKAIEKINPKTSGEEEGLEI